MACNEEWLEIISAWHDGEATPDEARRAREHLLSCAACQTARSRFRLLGDALKSTRVHTWDGSRPPARPETSRRLRTVGGPLLTAALVAAAAMTIVFRQGSPDGGKVVVDELEARHLTAFARAPADEFESADPAAVRAWIADHFGKQVEVPIVPGARLLGARRCNLSDKPTVSVMYRRGREPLSLFISPAGTSTAIENARLARAKTGCTMGRLGTTVCARPGLFAVAETPESALAALSAF